MGRWKLLVMVTSSVFFAVLAVLIPLVWNFL
jgi:hypothetical protein